MTMSGVGTERERDPVRGLGYLADPVKVDNEEWTKELSAVRRANHCLNVIQKLNTGSLKGVAKAPFRCRSRALLARSLGEKELSHLVLTKARSLAPDAGRLTGIYAVRAILGSKVSTNRNRVSRYLEISPRSYIDAHKNHNLSYDTSIK